MLSDVLKRKSIYNYFSRSAMEKAVSYQAQGRVSKLKVSDDRKHVSAEVRGSNSNRYRVDILLQFSGGELVDLDGDCSCPMDYNCKHAATLLEALSGKEASASGTAASSAPAAPPVLSSELTGWIDSVGRAVRGDGAGADQSQCLLYCLEPSNYAMPRLELSLLSVRVLKGGGFADNYTSPSLYEFKAERAPKYFRDVDIDIMRQVAAGTRSYYEQGPYSEELLKRIVGTGRAFWLDRTRNPLTWADARVGRIEWRPAGKHGLTPHLLVAGAVALNAEPPVYVDEGAGLIGLAQLDLPPRLAFQILSAPAIPRAQVEEVSRRLSQKLPELHHGLLPAPPAVAVPIEEDPRPVLRLRRGHVMSYYSYSRGGNQERGPAAVASLGFRYGGFDIDPTQRAGRVELFQAGKVFAITRRQSKEKQARKRLADIGFREARTALPTLDYSRAADLTLGGQSDWFDFLAQHAGQLQSEGFEILIDEDFPFRLADSSGDFDAALESSGIDWFELALGIDIDGERHDLAPHVAALVSAPGFTPDRLRQLAEEGERFYLPLTDGR